MKTTDINPILEMEFDHHKGKFKGYIRNVDGNLFRVLITSNPTPGRRPNYKAGEVRYINSSTPYTPTGQNPYRKPKMIEE